MFHPAHPMPRAALATCVLVAAQAIAQNTEPFWSTYFGTAPDPIVPLSGLEHAVIVKRAPGGLIVVAGHATAGFNGSSVATPGVFQTAVAGSTDAFVACFDPSQPPARQLVWCTYFGGTGMEFVFDAEVDASGITTIVGLSTSPTLPPAPGQPAPTRNGPTDGFVAQIGPMGQVLLASMFFGGIGDDRVCDVEVDANGVVTIAGVTEAPNSLPNADNTYRGGPTDAFVARVVPMNPPPAQVLWATYVGGSSNEGITFASWGGLGFDLEGRLDRMALTLDAVGNPVVAMISVLPLPPGPPAQSTPNAVQPLHAGAGDAYVAMFDLTLPLGTRLVYGTFFGGSNGEWPKAIAPHPGGGFVLGGLTFSTNLRPTPGCLQPTKVVSQFPFVGADCDGFVCHIDPALGSAGLLYSTHLGGIGEDTVYALAVERSGVVTVAGGSAGSSFWLTPRSWDSALGAQHVGAMVARLELAGNGASDLLYATLVGGIATSTNTNLTGLALDEYGDVYIAGYHGRNNNPTTNTYPTTANAFQPANAGGRDAVIAHLPLLPGGLPGICVIRQQQALATPACGAAPIPLYTGMAQAPVPGVTVGFTATNAPRAAPGALVLGTATPPVQLLNTWLLAIPGAILFRPSNPLGFARQDIVVPPGLVPVACWGLSAQWLFLDNGACTGRLATSERLDF